eukprot:TRINITY_DN57_c0_g1_i6.p1 TRINITY_DN57_c0_g1~~TRINITY_DN57_c0_g1_i6.p1  ORF type:complete len:3361 (+),score=947.88 TRINITY_DN57_c0_g1_i6:1118-11200(+)
MSSRLCFLLAHLFSVLYICRGQPINCPFEPLPTTLNSIAYLGFNGETHLQGEYFVNFSTYSQYIPFTVASLSAFRVYVAPHEVDVDIWLFNSTGAVARSSLAIGTEEVIQTKLAAGSYSLRFSYFGFSTEGYSVDDCDTIQMELAIVPVSLLQQRTLSLPCTGELLPSPNIVMQSHYNYNSDADGRFYNVLSSYSGGPVRWVTSYNFTTNATGGASFWSLEAILGFDFVSGGSLGLLLVQNTNNAAPDLNCVASGTCSGAEGRILNEKVLRAVLMPNTAYSLWLYDFVAEKDPSLSPCTGFTLKLHLDLANLPQSFTTCTAPSVPASLIPGQFDDPAGVLHYFDTPVVQLSQSRVPVTINISSPSFFKVYVSSPRLDIDIRLVNSAGQTIGYSYKFGTEETMAKYLQPDSYVMTLIYFGNYAPVFCETFTLEVAISPANIYQNMSFCATNASNVLTVAPDLSGLGGAGFNGSYSLRNNLVYQANYNGDWSTRPLLVQNFTVTQTSSFKALLNDDFLLGDLEVYLINYNAPGPNQRSTSVNRRNQNHLFTTINPGFYGFVIATGPAGAPATLVSPFPPCAVYTLHVHIQPEASTSVCSQYDRVPSTLNTVRYLGPNGAGIVHLQDYFLIPLVAGTFSVSESIAFTVAQNSAFRVWTEAHHIDIDLYLYRIDPVTGRQVLVASVIKLNSEEEIIQTLSANISYRLTIIYYHWTVPAGHPDAPCYTYNMELAIRPLSASTAPLAVSCSGAQPNVASLIPAFTPGQSFFTTAAFAYNQGTAAYRLAIPVMITGDFANFRATASYSFGLGDLSVSLLSASGSVVVHAENSYNQNDLGVQLLGPGNYTLLIYEPVPIPQAVAVLRGCRNFVVTVGYSPSGTGQLPVGCPVFPPPATLNSLPYLSAYSQNRTHFSRPLLPSVERTMDYVDFTLYTTSVFSVYIPATTSLDVDLLLRNGTSTNPGTRIDLQNGYREEAITQVLPPGVYNLQFRYYGINGARLPDRSECVSFNAEFAVSPVSYLAIPQVTTPCTDSPNSFSIALGNSSGTYQRSSSGSLNYRRMTSIVLNTEALLTLDVRYEFQTGGLAVDVVGVARPAGENPVPVNWVASTGTNHAYLIQVLPPGTYNVTIKNPFVSPYMPSGSFAGFVCSSYEVSYSLVAYSAQDGPQCSNVDQLPTDLFSAAGGSAPYGGPQSIVDGSVRIFGDNFLIDPRASRHHYILFNISVPSFIRMFGAGGPTDDVDFMIYSVVGNNSVSGLIYYAGGVDSVESALVRLAPQPGSYALDVYVFRVSPDSSCPVITFEVAIKSVTTVQNELLCPTVMPNPAVPPSYVSVVGAQQEVYIFDDFVFTQQFIQQNTFGGDFRYRITINVGVNTTLMASIGFDFLANNFRLVLLDINQRIIVNGQPWSTAEADDYFNFYNLLMADVPPGTYFLDIREALGANYGVTGYCHRFEWFLTSNSLQAPMVSTIYPAGRTNMNPFETLWITATFSEAVVFNYTTNDQLLSLLTSLQAVYLAPSTNIARLYPTSALFNRAMRTLTMSYNGMLFNQNYTLVLNTTVFFTPAGQRFVGDNQTHVYATTTCGCSGQGSCTFNSTWYSCTCNTGYTGQNCEKCAIGYHAAGSFCVPNVVCTSTSCGPYGTCYQTTGGSIGCTCQTGYATAGDSFCSVCAPGWTGFPNCTSTGDDQRQTTCLAPIMPDTFDTFDFLGYNREFHLEGDYFIDVNNFKHDITFTLTAPSVFRLYIEAHYIDLDFWLYPLNPDGSLGPYIDNGIAIYREEASVQLLPGVSAGTQYLLRLRYYVWDRSKVTYCDTFSFEVAISPATSFSTEAKNVLAMCTPTNSMPPLSSNGTFALLPQTDFLYNPTQLFTVRSTSTTSKTPNYVYSYNFTVNAPKRKGALLHAQVDYRFVVGDVSLMLESGNDANHCGALGAAGTRCTAGENHRNFDVLHTILQSGNYTLWIYEPIPQKAALSNCTAFQYQFMVTYVDLTEDIFVCEANPLPENFNVPGFKDASGRLHVSSDFLIDDTVVVFSVNQTTAFRAATDSEGAAMILSLYNSSNFEVASSFFGLNPQLFAILPPDNYTLEMVGYAFSDFKCPIVHLEAAAAPMVTYPNLCPATSVLPDLSGLTIPFDFGHVADGQFPAVYYTYYSTNTPWQYNFVVTQPMLIEAILHQDFLTSDLVLVLTNRANQFNPIIGVPRYNQNYLRQTVVNGSYSLSIMTRTGPRPAGFPPCAEFNFELSFVPSAQDLARPCAHLAEALPTTFNTIRYLDLHNAFVYQTPNMRVPDFNGFLSRSIYFTVNQPSMFRVYTEPHVVDIDLALYINGSQTALIDAGYTFNKEEELVYVVQPNVVYRLSMLFWKWNSQIIPQCPTFNFEASITPLHPLPPFCPNNADHWPPNPQLSSDGFYDYNSADTAESLYFQQSTSGTRSNSYTFTLNVVSNLYSEVNYHFPTGDLNLNLTSGSGSTAVNYYGSNTLNGNALNLLQLSPGTYTLTIYEVKQNDPSVLGCSPFSFQLLITADNSSTLGMDALQLPSTFDSIAYLYAPNTALHLQDYYTMFVTSDYEVIPFTIYGSGQTIIRISTDHFVNNVRALPIRILYADNTTVNYAPNGENLLAIITAPGNVASTLYYLRFDRPRRADGSMTTGPVLVNLQVEISSYFKVQNDLSPWANCPAGVGGAAIDPMNIINNYYSYGTTLQVPYSKLQSQAVLQSVPFNLTDSAVIYTRLGFQYLPGAIEIVLTGTALDGTAIAVDGRDGYNYDEINEVLPAGSYVLSLIQNTNLWGSQYPQQCAISTFRVTIFPLSAESHVDCTSYKMLPYNLNSPTGGSSPYGGPVDSSGAIHVFGTQFLMPPAIATSTAQSVIAFNISKPSLISVITKEQYVSGDIRYTIRTTSSMQLIIPPLSMMTDNYQQSGLWLVNPPTNGAFQLVLTYRHPPSTACPYFGLQLAMRPASDVQLYATCNPQLTQVNPNVQVTPDANGLYNEYFESYWPSQVVASPQTNGTFTYSINITITSNSQMQASIGFNSLMNMYRLQLLRVLPRYTYEVAKGTWQQQQIGTANIDLSQYISSSLLTAGQYILIISQLPLALPFGGANDPRCLPFTWDLHIVPTNTPTLSASPVSAEGLSPYNLVNLYLTFSQPVYAGGYPLNSSYSTPLKQALSLTPTTSSTLSALTPTLVQPDGRSGMYWRVTFPAPGAAASKVAFVLLGQLGALTNQAGTNVALLASYHYGFADVSCSGHGAYEGGYCFCNLGYAGDACELCDNGYNNTAGGFPATCQKSNAGPCFVDSCGCLPNISPCIPNGYCNASTGSIVCSCLPRFGGPSCTQCAPGRYNYPTCTANACNPPCVHGSCDDATATCRCESGGQGPTCRC